MRRLEIKDFKCIKDDEIEFLDLTVLAGNNGAGKSTVIQTMLIMLQSFNKKESILLPKNYYINDYYCELGNTSKLLFKESNEDVFNSRWGLNVGVNFEAKTHSLVFNAVGLWLEMPQGVARLLIQGTKDRFLFLLFLEHQMHERHFHQ